LCYGGINTWVVKVEVGNENVQQSLCTMHSVLEVLYILGCRISAAIRRLIVRAVCVDVQ
jgi:hypothetical protein